MLSESPPFLSSADSHRAPSTAGQQLHAELLNVDTGGTGNQQKHMGLRMPKPPKTAVDGTQSDDMETQSFDLSCKPTPSTQVVTPDNLDI